MTDVINEYFGQRGVRILSNLAVLLIAYAFVMVYFAIGLEPAGWWVEVNQESGVPNMQAAFTNIFGQGMWIIAGSLCAFLIGQIADVMVYHRIRKITGEKKIWLRATGSTLVSQLVDTFVVLYISFVLGPQQWSMSLFFAVATVSYAYKFTVAILLTPVIYLAHYLIDSYLGEDLANELKARASS
jgi:uncharacterized integral membrane protein (TIGR00697 family)